MFEKIYVFTISQKNIEKITYNVYIFGIAHARPFQICFKHVHTTSVGNSTTPQLGIVIQRNRVEMNFEDTEMIFDAN